MAERFQIGDVVTWTAPNYNAYGVAYFKGEQYEITDVDDGDSLPYWLVDGGGNGAWVRDSQVGPVVIAPEPPKFTSIEDADAWLAQQAT